MIMEDSFNKLYRQLEESLKARIRSIIRDPERSEELYQETFLKAWEKRESFKNGNMQSWIFRIATNLCFDELRRRAKAPINESKFKSNEADEEAWNTFLERKGNNPFPAPDEQALSKEMIQALHRALGSLDPHQKELIDLVYLQEVSLKKAAENLGIPYGTAKSRLHYSVKKLSDIIESVYPKEEK